MLRVAETIQRTDTGLQRRGNEDSSLARSPIFVVADGMGGARGGEVASQLAVKTFEQGLGEGASAEERLAARVQEANTVIFERSQTDRDLFGMGTTLTAAYVDDAHVAVAHVGDSRCYLFREDGLTRMTRDHSLIAELVQRGKLTEEQAAEHPQRSIITRALGPEATVEVDTWSYSVRAGDVLLLCSDGLTTMLSEEQITQILAANHDLSAAADALITAANAAGGRDNITVVLLRLEEVGEPGGVDQPTVAAAPGDLDRTDPPAADQHTIARAPAVGAPTAESQPTPVAVAERTSGPRLARTQGRPQAPAPRGRLRNEKLIKPVSAVLAVLIVVFLIGGGGYIATRQLYFVGTDSRGIVTLFRGLPYAGPFGLRLYETFYQSGVPAAMVPKNRRAALFNHHLRSQSSGTNLVMALEKGQLSK